MSLREGAAEGSKRRAEVGLDLLEEVLEPLVGRRQGERDERRLMLASLGAGGLAAVLLATRGPTGHGVRAGPDFVGGLRVAVILQLLLEWLRRRTARTYE